MKNIFGAKAQTTTFVKSISLLMLVFLVTFGVTSCKNETTTAVSQPTKYENVLDTKAITVPVEVETQKQLEELGTNSEINYKSLCIGGGTAGQERRTLTIGGGQAVPRSATDIGGNQTSRKLIGIGGNGAGSTMPRNLTNIGGNGGQVSRRLAIGGHETGQRKVTDIGGNQTARRLVDIGGNGAGSSLPRRFSDIGGNGVTRTLFSKNDNPKASIDAMDIGGGLGGTVRRLRNSNSPGASLT